MNDAVKAISIHALREEGDGIQFAGGVALYQFLSTPSARRATVVPGALGPPWGISIHALREEGDVPHILQEYRQIISIHALREEGDSKNRDKISIFL